MLLPRFLVRPADPHHRPDLSGGATHRDDPSRPGLGQPDRPPILLRGGRVALAPLDAVPRPPVARWRSDPVTSELGGDEFRPWPVDPIGAEWARMPPGQRAGFALFALPEFRPIGPAHLRDQGTLHRAGEFGITIGGPADRGRGFGTETTRLVLRWAFTDLGVHDVWLDPMSANHATIRAHANAGVREIGRMCETGRIGGGAADVALMDCPAARV